MGIRSLSDFIDTNYPSIGSWFRIESSSDEIWIIDANAVFYYLCSNNDHLEESVSKILNFQSSISKCSCIWVFDGESIIEKLPTQISRASNVLKATWLPLGLISIITATFKSMGIQYIIAPGEADGTIAHLAFKHKACIVSNDSDFYIYESVAYIPLQYLTVCQDHIYGKKITNKEVASMMGITVEALPIFAVLVGNDTFTGIDAPHMKKTTRIKYWTSMLRSNNQLIHSAELKNAAQQYCIPDAITYKFYLNADLSLAASQGKLDPLLLKLLHHKIFWCGNLLEDVKRESAWDASIKIRQQLYSFLFSKDTVITEYCRRGMKFTSKTFKVHSSTEYIGEEFLYKSFGLDHKAILKIPTQFRPFIACVKSLINYFYDKGTPLLDFQLNSLLLSAVMSSRTSNLNPGSIWNTKTPSFIHLKAQMQILLFVFHTFQQSIWPLENPMELKNIFLLLEPSILYHNLTMTRKGASVEKLLKGMNGQNQMMNEFNLLKEYVVSESRDQISCF